MVRFSPRGTYAVYSNHKNNRSHFQMRVMVVEDDQATRESLTEFLKNFLQAEVIGFADAHCALQAVEVFKPHVAILDHGLPCMNGVELTKKIKAISPYCYIAMISGSADIGIAVKAMRAGCENFIRKPFHIDDIAACLNEATYMAKNVKSLEEIEAEHIENVVATSSTLDNAAEKLGINSTTLWRKRKKVSKAA